MKLCEWCDNDFKPLVSYQIYCSTTCRDAATKEKIVERHKILQRKKRKNKKRFCASGCGTPLSIYNDGNFCLSCDINEKHVELKLRDIRRMMRGDGND